MFNGANGRRFPDNDPNHIGMSMRPQDEREHTFQNMLREQEARMRDFLLSIPQSDTDGRAKSSALTKLDELVMWATRAINH